MYNFLIIHKNSLIEKSNTITNIDRENVSDSLSIVFSIQSGNPKILMPNGEWKDDVIVTR